MQSETNRNYSDGVGGRSSQPTNRSAALRPARCIITEIITERAIVNITLVALCLGVAAYFLKCLYVLSLTCDDVGESNLVRTLSVSQTP